MSTWAGASAYAYSRSASSNSRAASSYAIPQTAVLGTILVTGYMGGTIATHVRVGDNFVIQALIPILAWLGLFLRDPRLRAAPLRTSRVI